MLNTFATQVKEYNHKSARVFLKYTLRHRIKSLLREDLENYKLFYDSLNHDAKMLFCLLERIIYKHCFFLSTFFIDITKIRWRMRGYPVCGERLDKNKCNNKYFNW